MRKTVTILVSIVGLLLLGCGKPSLEKGNKQNGLYTKYYPSGKISYTVPYKNSKRNGYFKDYDRQSQKVTLQYHIRTV